MLFTLKWQPKVEEAFLLFTSHPKRWPSQQQITQENTTQVENSKKINKSQPLF